MDFNAFKCAVFATIKTITDSFSLKVIFTAITAILLHKHSVLFFAFSLLVGMDCFTKWIELSSKNMRAAGSEQPTILQSVLNLRKARREGAISSEVMKHRFLGKVAVYLICALSAAVVDMVMLKLNQPYWAVTLVIGYLVATELLSIIENLSGAGVSQITSLVDLIKKKIRV